MLDEINLSSRIADHAASVRYETLPESTRHCTRRALLDAIGVMVAATGISPDVGPYRHYAAQIPGRCRLLGSAVRTSPGMAALANGALAHALDYGDTFDAGPAHPNAALVPALLALADADPSIEVGAFVAAMAVGSDLACRFSLAPANSFESGGWYPPPLVNLVASAAAAAKLLGLDAEGIRHAMGLAILQASFPEAIKYDATSPVRGVREAFAARGAVEAALLAGHGAKAFADPLGGRGGFFEVYAGGIDQERLLDGLGGQFLGDRVSFKPWPACRGTHAYIEAALALRDRFALGDVAEIGAETGPVQEMLIRPLQSKARPTNPIDARFSIPFTVAAALVDGEVTLETFLAQNLADPRFRRIVDTIRERPNASWGRAEAARGGLTVILRDGSRFEHHVAVPAGSPDRPLDDAALLAKFVTCGRYAGVGLNAPQLQDWGASILRGDASLPATVLIAESN